MIEIERVSKSFCGPSGRKVILQDASLQIPKRMCLGIIAPNGTGKSTVLNLLAGFDQCNSGRIFRHGSVSPPLGLAAGLIHDRSGTDNIRLISRLNNCDPDHAETFVRWLTGMGQELHQPVRMMSLGMRARLTLAVLLAADFDTYLIDEGIPTTTDVGFNRRAANCIKAKLKTSNLVLVSHQSGIVKSFCTHIVYMSGGKFSQIQQLTERPTGAQQLSKIAA